MNKGVVSKQNLERLFLRYRREGCPRSLGRVFDATAPHLLRVAGHLTGDRAEAEDLLVTLGPFSMKNVTLEL